MYRFLAEYSLYKKENEQKERFPVCTIGLVRKRMSIIRVACLQARFMPDFFIAMKEAPVKKGGGHD